MQRAGYYGNVLIPVAMVAVMAVPVQGQELPWFSFTDGITGQVCDVVHTDSLELVVSRDPLTGLDNFVIVTGSDVRLEDTEILENNDVLYLGQPAGFIVFAEDDEGFLALWWVGLGNSVVTVDLFTGEPDVTNLLPGDLVVSTCDACDLWDDPNACPTVPDIPPIDFNFCGVNTALAMMMTMVGLVGTRVARRRVRR